MTTKPPMKTAATQFEIIETIVDLDGARVSELAAELDRPDSTVHDYLRSLTELGYLIQKGDEYHLSTRFLELGVRQRDKRELYKQARPKVDDLAVETGEHASLMIEEHGRGVLLHTARGEDAVQVDTHSGMRIRLHTTAPGKVVLAHLPEERIDEIVNELGLPAMTQQTITDKDALLESLEMIREQGYALDREERIEGMRAVAAPIFGRDNYVAGAISIYGPTSRIDNEAFTETLPKRLLRTANVIELNLNYS